MSSTLTRWGRPVAGDLRFLLGLGLTVEQLARRTGRTRTAIMYELKQDDETKEQDDERK